LSSAAPPGKTKLLQPVPVNLGTWDVDELQLAEMGNYGPEGEHLCVGKIALS
jgi:activating signal cointegrator complex subunit 1